MGDSTSSQLSARILYGRKVVADLHEQLGQSHDRTDVPELAKLPGILKPGFDSGDARRPVVGIVGGGVAGLYAAMMLKDAGVPYLILEAQAKERLGGRLFTHHFPNGGKYDYYDVGAMRFPDTPWMGRTFQLFKKLNVPLLEYKMKTGFTFMNFNDKLFQRSAVANDPLPKDDVFGVNSFVPNSNLLPNYSEPVTRAMQPFRDTYVKDGFKALWEKLMKYDHLSMRGYLIEVMGFPAQLVNWLETYNTSSNSYDRAFTEAVLDTLAFDYPGFNKDKNVWRCVDGGSSVLPQYMIKYLERPATGRPPLSIRFEERVMSISKEQNGRMVVETDKGVYRFDHVISTIPLPTLSIVDLRGCQLAWPIKAALRQLSYGPSTKIGIRFKENWWWKLFKIDGGQTLADVPIRRVVYPSYGPTEPRSRVLIVSYAWTQDAERLGALMGNNPRDKALLRDIVVRDLERVHGLNKGALKPYIDNSDDSIHPYNWYADSHSMGAFAFFGPGDFKTIYPWVTQVACDGRLHFAGEATSSEHAWVVGALNSAHRAVSEIIRQHGDEDETQQNLKEFEAQWGENAEFPGDDLTRHIYLGLQASKAGAQT